MSFLHEPGDLARTPLAAILLEALNLRATGVLTVKHGGGASRLFIKEGKPVGAQVVAGIRPLGHMLLQEGVIDIDTLSRSLALMAESARPQGEILVEMGAVSREQVERALAEQQAGYFDLIAALESGSYQFDPAALVPAWADQRLLSPLRTIVDALERPQAGALVISALQPVASATVRLASGYRSVASAFRWTPRERILVARLETPATLEALFAPSDVSPERARAIVAGLLLLGLAVQAGETAQPTGETGAGLDLELDVSLRPGGATPPPATPPPGPARRSDPAEARARRQRLLQQAMRNMGIGPFAAPGRTPPPPLPSPPKPEPTAPGTEAHRPARDTPEASLRRSLLEALPRARERDLFARLGLPGGAGREEVKQAFLSLARQFHPDRFAAPALADLADTVREFFTTVNEAYETLSDEKKRNAYLSRGEGGGGAQDPQSARIDFTKGEACLRTRDWVKARGFFEAAIRCDPQPDYKAALALAIIHDPASHDRERARALAEEALRTPSCDRAAYVAGILARDEKDLAKAEKLFRAALAANPRNADAARELRLLERRRAR
ncbi:MAG TPA: DnaJ domain-containing protein [Anaeromyxobacter sp.]|nr:DnaJ domain-containing protein [Anaeromyxobacter sp.]